MCGRPQGAGGSDPYGRMWTGEGSQTRDSLVDVIPKNQYTGLPCAALESKLGLPSATKEGIELYQREFGDLPG